MTNGIFPATDWLNANIILATASFLLITVKDAATFAAWVNSFWYLNAIYSPHWDNPLFNIAELAFSLTSGFEESSKHYQLAIDN